MKITKEQILELSKESSFTNATLHKWFPEAFKTKLEVGKIYSFGLFLIKVVSDATWYGFNSDGKWEDLVVYPDLLNDKDLKEATEEEWEAVLIKEAIKRGLYSNKKTMYKYKDGTACLSNPRDSKFIFRNGSLILWDIPLLKDGIWVEIIKSEIIVDGLTYVLK
jgi:hypothetical protein